MKKTILLSSIIVLMISVSLFGQKNEIIPDLSKSNDTTLWVLNNRDVDINEDVYLNGKPGDGILWLKSPLITNGRIELDIKGKDEKGKSFVGLAFHGLNDTTFDAVYFRPFNFKNPDRNGHSIQYISHPEFPWYKLRKEHPEQFENLINPVPEPNEWFHVLIIIKYPAVEVFVNNSEKPSLSIEQLSSQKTGWIGFWVGNNSEGYFRNLKIIPE